MGVCPWVIGLAQRQVLACVLSCLRSCVRFMCLVGIPTLVRASVLCWVEFQVTLDGQQMISRTQTRLRRRASAQRIPLSAAIECTLLSHIVSE
jgi:hypothetical protein